MNPRDICPIVAPPRDMLPLPVMLGVAAALGAGLFLWMEGQRKVVPEPQAQAMLSVPPPPLVLPEEAKAPVPVIAPSTAPRAVVKPPPPVVYMPPSANYPPPPVAQPTPLRPAGNHESALVIDNTTGHGAEVQGGKGDGNEGGEETAHATIIRGRSSTIPQGTIIAATLETPLNSDRPGLARAIVGQDVRGFDGTRVLIPRGSRLIGEFKADNSAGKRRVMVTWNRLIRPDGVAIRIASPATDAMGAAGIAGRVDTHALEKLAGAVLQSALTLGVNVATAEVSRGGTAVYLGLGGAGQSVGQQLVPGTNRPATVKVKEGAAIAVLVARDLDFAGMPGLR